MTNQYEFTNDEWDTIVLAPGLIGEAIAAAADSGLIGGLRESRSIDTSIAADVADNPAKQLIDAVSAVDHKDQIDKLGGGAKSADALATDSLIVAGEVATILAARSSPQEAAGYAGWLIDVATSVASAAKEDGVRISQAEADLIQRLATALGVDHQP